MQLINALEEIGFTLIKQQCRAELWNLNFIIPMNPPLSGLIREDVAKHLVYLALNLNGHVLLHEVFAAGRCYVSGLRTVGDRLQLFLI